MNILRFEIEISTFQEKNIPELKTWFNDTEVKKRLGGLLPLEKWFANVKNNAQYFILLAHSNTQVVGLAIVDIEDSKGNIAIVTQPDLRNKGVGKQVIKKVMNLPEMHQVKKWYAGIEADNSASLRCFQSVGYILENSEPDEDGYYSVTMPCISQGNTDSIG